MVSSNTISITAPPGLVSIIIPCCGMLDYTKLCVPSVLRYSREPFELIFLDIGSLDGTAEYLAGLRDGLHNRVRVEICRAATDLHIPEAVEDAIQAARGEFICLLNNDTVVTAKWLDALTGLAQLSPGHGMVGPMSNQAPEGQRVDVVPYRLGPKKGARPGEPLLVLLAEILATFSAEIGSGIRPSEPAGSPRERRTHVPCITASRARAHPAAGRPKSPDADGQWPTGRSRVGARRPAGRRHAGG